MKKTHTIVGRGNHTEVVDKENIEVEQPLRGGRKDHTEMVESTTWGWRKDHYRGGEKSGTLNID